MKCQRRILRISWQQFVCNEEVRDQTGLSPVLDIISHRRISVFGHIARLQDSVPAHKARLLVDLQTPLGDVDLVGHVAGGSTRSGGIPPKLLLIIGDWHKDEAIDVEK